VTAVSFKLLQDYSTSKSQQQEFSPPPGVLLTLIRCFMTYTSYPWHLVSTLRYCF